MNSTIVPRAPKRWLRRLGAAMISIVMALAGLGAAWVSGWNVPGATGSAWVKVSKLQARYTGPTTGPVFIMLVGSDLRPGVGGARGDALHILGINPALHAATILNIPRDTCASVGSKRRKINEANSHGGAAAQAQAVTDLTGIPLQYAVEVDFAGFKNLVDGVGGLDIDIPAPMRDKYSGAVFAKGPQHITSDQALAFSRNRHGFPRSDLQRTWNQGYLLIAAVKQLQQQYATISGKFTVASLLMRHAQLSGLTIADVVRLGQFANDIPSTAINNISIPATSGGCLGVDARAAQQLYSDFKDNARLDTYPAGTFELPDPRP